MKRIESFTLEAKTLPRFTENNVKEFTNLNTILTRLMENNLKSYRTQKEFIENASHELQTPLVVFQSKLDILLQENDLTEAQVGTIQSLYEVSNRLSRLNKNLLLLARIDKNQHKQLEQMDVVESMINNLVVNAVRHNKEKGEI